MIKKCSFKKVTNTKLIIKTVLICILFYSLVFSLFAITSYQKKQEYCKAQREYIEVYIRGALEGKYDNGKVQKTANGEYFINLNDAEHTSTINYQGKNLKCFILTENIEEYSFTLADLRGSYLADESLKSTPFITLLPENRTFICPFSRENNEHYYCITENGTVICSCPQCQ